MHICHIFGVNIKYEIKTVSRIMMGMAEEITGAGKAAVRRGDRHGLNMLCFNQLSMMSFLW